MKPTNMSDERKKQIAEAVFDRFIRRKFVVLEEIGFEIKIKEINDLAGKIGCVIDSLHLSIRTSRARINRVKVLPQQPQKDELNILFSTVKLEILESCISPKNYKREFSKIVFELNNQNPGLKLTTKELLNFIIPSYVEMVKETFGLNL